MARTMIYSGLLVSLAYFVYWRITVYLSNKRFRKFAEDNGCQEPQDAPGPMGFARLMRML